VNTHRGRFKNPNTTKLEWLRNFTISEIMMVAITGDAIMIRVQIILVPRMGATPPHLPVEFANPSLTWENS
jgi:hypothetical protein